MTKPNVADERVPVRAGDESPVAIRPELLAAVEMMLDAVPEAGGDAFESIIGNLVSATDVRDLDAPWRTAGMREIVNQRIRIDGIRKSPSDFKGGIPWFLLVDGAFVETGEIFTVTTGAASIVVQLAKAAQLGGFPLVCIPRESSKPSANGYYPMHLEMVQG